MPGRVLPWVETGSRESGSSRTGCPPCPGISGPSGDFSHFRHRPVRPRLHLPSGPDRTARHAPGLSPAPSPRTARPGFPDPIPRP